jgi:hypothetical protein
VFMDRSSAPLVGETSCGAWRRLWLGDVRRTAATPLRGGEQTFLHGLSRSPGVRSVRLLHTTSSFNGHWVRGLFGLSLSRVRLPLRRSGRWHLGSGRECAAGGADGPGGRRR